MKTTGTRVEIVISIDNSGAELKAWTNGAFGNEVQLFRTNKLNYVIPDSMKIIVRVLIVTKFQFLDG